VVLAILTAALLSADPLSAPWRAESFSVSDPRGVLSLGANPAGLASTQDWEFVLEGSQEGPERRSAVLASAGHFAAGWTSSPESFMPTLDGIRSARQESWIFGFGVPLPGGLGLGAKAQHRSIGETSMGWSADLGAIWRPVRFLGLGWDWRNAGGRDGSSWEGHGFGVGVRPFGTPFFTLGWEAWKGGVPDFESYQTDHDVVQELQGEVRPFPWFALNGRWIPQEGEDSWSFGVSAQVTPYTRFFSRTQPRPEGGPLQGVGVHLGGSFLPDAGMTLPGSVLYHVGALSGEAGSEGLVHSKKGFAQVRDDLLLVAARSKAKVVVLDLGSGAMPLSQAGQLRRLVLKLRESGKRVVAWSQDLTMASLHVMSACDKAAISPLGTVRSRGLAMRTIYAGSALRKHGVDIQVVRTGPWKSAMEHYVADRMSDEARSDLEMHLHDLDSMILGGVAMGRRMDAAKLVAWIDTGSMLPAKAVQAGLLDTLVEPQELMSWAAPGTHPVTLPLAPDAPNDWGVARRVAVISLEGQIVDGKGSMGMVPWGQNLQADAVAAVLRELKDDASVGAVVLRVNSPGGSVVGSERIRRAVAELDKEKPVVASFGSVAASGAYLFSLPARRIWTEPEAIVGSIGVFTAKVSIGRLLDSLGLHVETVSTGPDAGSSSVLAAMDSSQSARVREQIEDAHRMFGDLVKKSRKLDSTAFSKIGGGRVFTGARSVENGLADSLGGLEDAVAWVAREAGLAEPAGTVWLVPGSGRWETMLSRLEMAASDKPWARYEALLSAPGTAMWAQLPWEIDGP